jgi:carbon storage regulator
MLVLSRKTGERIHIGDNITIEVRRVAGNRVTLALDAPRSLRILRGELAQAAREFQDTENTGGDSQPYLIVHRRLTVPDAMPPEQITRDFVI